jgi:nitrate reductase gamma subunit
MDLLELAQGPFLDGAAILFLVGMGIRIVQVLTRPRVQVIEGYARAPAASVLWSFLLWVVPTLRMWRRNPLVPVAGWVFHLGFFVTLFGTGGHGLIWDHFFGVSWTGLETGLLAWSAAITLAALVVLVFNHLTNPAVRVLGTPRQLVTHLIVGLPLLTGLALTQGWLEPFTLAMTVHILSAELLLVYIPFSRLSHVLLFFVMRTAWGLEAARRGVRP